MFCFCLQSSLLKLQALEVEGGPSLGPSPEESPPALGSKEQKSPCGPVELGEKDGKTLALCHSVPADENSPPELLTVLTRPPQSPRYQPLTTIHLGQQPLTPDAALPPSPHHSPYSPQRSSPGGEGGGGGEGEGGGGGALLQLLAGGPSPLPSPRCSSLSHSLRFNSDPETAPSPPCSQQYILCRGRDMPEGSEDECPSSIPFLSRQIQTLKKRVRRFEDQFEQEMNYKPSHNDKYSNPEMIRVMSELAKARKQLKELRLRQSVFESKEEDAAGNTCRYISGQQGASEHKPTLEETVESLFRRLREKRQALGLPDNMKDMTQAQMVLEKITLQKCLLYFESLHGRPVSRRHEEQQRNKHTLK
uniref:Family with sequence similarity 13 member C n=1 Tax=Sparus aurata TaxID=8175 RepID=A0A671X1H8_SPAAU